MYARIHSLCCLAPSFFANHCAPALSKCSCLGLGCDHVAPCEMTCQHSFLNRNSRRVLLSFPSRVKAGVELLLHLLSRSFAHLSASSSYCRIKRLFRGLSSVKCHHTQVLGVARNSCDTRARMHACMRVRQTRATTLLVARCKKT